jgi:hypothetical protein
VESSNYKAFAIRMKAGFVRLLGGEVVEARGERQ